VVLLSRASDSPLEVFWRLRYTVLAAVLLCLAATAVVSAFLSRVISRPVVEITGAAEAVARGEPLRSFRTSRLGPAEVNALGEALDRMTRQLTDRASYISQFATNLTHELKTPLTGIRGAVELLREDWGEMSQEQRRRFLDNIDADAARMERLATRLLQLARIQSSPETAEPIVVAPFFREVLRRYDGRVRLDVAVAPAEVVINPDHLETAVRNLVDNALRHGGDAPVDVVVRRSAGRLAVDVRDRGPGISQGNRARIFERFFTTQRDQGGTGLGLSIVRAVADTRGGRISFESGPTGTCFTLVV
jgi:two-component system sensor histidine kinase ChvG